MAKLKDWLKGIDYSVYAGNDEGEVRELTADSRKAGPHTLFVAIKGERADGHLFIPDAICLGSRDIVAERGARLPEDIPDGVNIIIVSDTREALADISAARFSYPASSLTLIGITGTKGKTSTSYMLKKVLDEAHIPAAVIGTNGCIIGDERIPTLNTTPDSLELNYLFRKMVDSSIRVCVMECSSQGFKLQRTKGLKFNIGIFLNIAPDHIGPGEHESFDEYLSCKKELMRQCDIAIINRDDAHADEFIDLAAERGAKVVTFSANKKDADFYASDMSFSFGREFSGSKFRILGKASGIIELSIPGDYYILNALSVIAAAFTLGVDISHIKKALKNVQVEGRMEKVISTDKFMCIVDYAHNGVSMENLIRTLRCYNPTRIVVVFGCGGNRSKDRRITMGESAARHADFAVITSDNSRFERPDDIIDDIVEAYLEAGGDESNFSRIADRREAIYYALKNAREGDIIAVIGKGHEDYQEENGVRHHFLDKEEILKAARRLGI